MSISPGALRFNTDSQKLELYDGNQWTEIVASSPDSQTGGARGVFGGGHNPSGPDNVINYITISTTGNALDFGYLSTGRQLMSTCSSSTRGFFGGGDSPSANDVIEFVTILTQGKAVDFGDLTNPRFALAALSNGHGGL